MPETQQQTQIPFSMEVAAGVVAEHCYQDRQFHQELLKDPLAAASQLVSKEAKSPVDLKEKLPNCKIHVLKNDNKRWHIVLPFEYRNEKPSLENGLLTEDDLEQVAGGIFGLGAATGAAALGVATTSAAIFTVGSTTFAAIPALVAGSVFAGSATAGTFLSTGVVAGITAGIIGGGIALAGGVAISAIAGLDAAGIIDTW